MLSNRSVLEGRTGRSVGALRPVLDTQAMELLNMSSRDLPSIDYLRQRLSYDPETGQLCWKICEVMPATWNGKWAGKRAGSKGGGKFYVQVCLDGKMYKAHRVAWALHYGAWPEDDIDHINHDRIDNRICNLRQTSRRENCRNSSLSRRNTSGHAGVTWCRQTNKWMAQIHPDGRCVNLGKFHNFEDAVAARKAAEAKYGFHANHGVEAPAAA